MGNSQMEKFEQKVGQYGTQLNKQVNAKININSGDIFPRNSNYENAQEKGERIQKTVVEIDAQLKNAAALYRQGYILDAKNIYVSQAELIYKLVKETEDDKDFSSALRKQLQSVIAKAESCGKQVKDIQAGRNGNPPQQSNQSNNQGQQQQHINQQQAQINQSHQQQQLQLQQQQQFQIQKQQEQISAVANLNGGMSEQERRSTISKLDKNMVQVICESIIDKGPGVKWDDIEGLKDVKQALFENIVYPQLRPEIFTGIRAPTKGILLYGPPGNGKTMLAKAVATECKCTFFSISASTLVSKWMGESEKLMRTLFALAAVQSPSIIFIDEVDSILTKRSSEEQEASRRLKTEFLIQLDGVGSSNTRILVIAATNRPFDLDEAALRRLTKRIYIGLPDEPARLGLITRLLKQVDCDLSKKDLNKIIKHTQGYSSADLNSLCKEAAMVPIREIPPSQLMLLKNANQIRKLVYQDFVKALNNIKPSVSPQSLQEYAMWHQNCSSL